MSSIKEFQNNCEFYRKYVTCLIINRRKYFTVWGADKEDKGNDKFLLNSFGKIALFKNVKGLFNSFESIEVVMFDKKRTTKWLIKTHNILNKKLVDHTSNEYVFNLNQFLKIIPAKKLEIVNLSPLKYNLFINVVNLINDYEYQRSNKSLLKLRKYENISLFWEYCYERVLWGVKNEDKPILDKTLLSKLKINDLRKKVLELHSTFLNYIHIMN